MHQFVRCRTFNVVVVAFFSDISWFTVDSFIWSLSLEVWYLLARYSLGDRAPTSHNAFWGSLDPWETTFIRHYLSLSSSHCPTRLSYCLTILELPYILGHGPRPNSLTRLIYPHNNNNYNNNNNNNHPEYCSLVILVHHCYNNCNFWCSRFWDIVGLD